MQAQRFAARWSPSVWIVTSIVILLPVFVMAVLMGTTSHNSQAAEAWPVVACVLVLTVILCAAVLFAPLGYAVMPQGVLIRRMGRSVAIGFEQIADARCIDSKEIGFALRIFGSGGFFGWFGRFYGSRLGWFTAYSTNVQNLVVITLTDGAKILISPEPAALFVQAVEEGRRGSR
jgi:hypothetical protein